jgi:hypothetical protein
VVDALMRLSLLSLLSLLSPSLLSFCLPVAPISLCRSLSMPLCTAALRVDCRCVDRFETKHLGFKKVLHSSCSLSLTLSPLYSCLPPPPPSPWCSVLHTMDPVVAISAMSDDTIYPQVCDNANQHKIETKMMKVQNILQTAHFLIKGGPFCFHSVSLFLQLLLLLLLPTSTPTRFNFTSVFTYY